jgi:hypothetical protein
MMEAGVGEGGMVEGIIASYRKGHSWAKKGMI